MGFSKRLFLSVLFTSVAALSSYVLAEETPVAGTGSIEISTPAPSLENDIQWAWGDVVSLDVPAKTVTIKYLDYETDQEKELVLTVDEKTTFENIKALEEIKLKDTLSIDYMVTIDNKNIAKNISLEKPDELPASLEPKDDLQPKETTMIPQVPAETPNQITEPAPGTKTQDPAKVEAPAPVPAFPPADEPQVIKPSPKSIYEVTPVEEPAQTMEPAPVLEQSAQTVEPGPETQPETSGQAQ